ncbi:hypothetical protein J7K03_01435 [bacterium]|nr:hypothetical protein [bacterium]
MKNLIILVLITTFFGSSIALAQKIPQIPQDIRNQVPEKDWIELYCYEAKSRGGEAVAKVEALAELLPPLLEKVEELGIKVETPDLLSISRDLESQLEEVCQQTTLEATQAKLQEFISKANSVRNTLGPDLRNQIEPALKAKGEEIRAKLEKELRAEGEAMGKEIEAKLRAQAEQEAKQIEARLRAELKQQIEEELKAQFGGQENIDKNYVLELGRRMGEERGQKAAQKARRELEEKYEKLAQQERERITKLIEKKADEIGGEEKRKLEEIRDGFLNLEANLESLAQAKMARWLVFREKAIQKKKEILIATMGAQIDKGKELIMAHKKEIDQARAEGKDIPSAEELIAQLEADKQSLIDKLSKGELDENLIRQAGEELKAKWEKIRFDMEKVKKRSAPEVYYGIYGRFSRQRISKRTLSQIDPNKAHWQQYLKFYQDKTQVCRDLGYSMGVIPELTEERIRKEESRWGDDWLTSICIHSRHKWCRDRFTPGTALEKMEKDLVELINTEKEFLSVVKEFLNYSENSSLEELLSYKERLVNKKNDYEKKMELFCMKYKCGRYSKETLERQNEFFGRALTPGSDLSSFRYYKSNLVR